MNDMTDKKTSPPKVSIVKCDGYSNDKAYESIKASLDLIGGMESFVSKDERILLKPNLLTAKSADRAVTTHPTIVHAVVRLVREAGAVPIVGDSPGIGSAVKVAEACGIMDVVKELDVEFVELGTPVLIDAVKGSAFKHFEVAKEALDVDGIINLPKLKTHGQMYMTMGVKNIFGCVPGKKKLQWHLTAGVDAPHFARMILDLYKTIAPRLNIIDAILSMEGNGPGSGDPRQTNFIAASNDAIALDTILAKVVGADIAQIPVLNEAAKDNLASTDLEEIKLFGEEVAAVAVDDFKFPPLIHTNFASYLPNFLDKRIRKALSARPKISVKDCSLCTLCARSCPPDIIKVGKKVEIDYDNCIRCYCCQEICPKGAITIKEGWLKKLLPGF